MLHTGEILSQHELQWSLPLLNSHNVTGMKVKCLNEDKHFVIDLKDMAACVAVSSKWVYQAGIFIFLNKFNLHYSHPLLTVVSITPENNVHLVFHTSVDGSWVILLSICTTGSNPAPIEIKSPDLDKNTVSNIPVAIVASNRPHYLYRAIRSMLSAHGAKKGLFTVYIDGFFEEPAAVAKLFDLKVVQHVPISSKNARISQVCMMANWENFELWLI